MAAAGTVAESLPTARRFSVVDEWGIAVTLFACVMLLLEYLTERRSIQPSSTGRT